MDPAVPQLATGDAPPASAPDPQATAPGPPAAAGAEPQSATAPPQVAGAAKRRKHGDVLGSVQSLAITIVIAVFVITFAVQAFQIPSESMEDTLLIGDYLLVDKVHFASGGVWAHSSL
jgi:signal peptidase I